MLKLKENKSKLIFPSEMKDGDIGVIRSGVYEGRLVQRYKNILISLGYPSGESFLSACGNNDNVFQIELLGEGSEFILQNNDR